MEFAQYSWGMKKSEALRILGLSDGASDDDIKSAHRKKVVENHPDKFASNAAEYDKAEEKTKLINEARDVLLSRKWEPEYAQRGPYANPYGNPYSRPYGGGSPVGYSGTSGRPSQGGYDPFGQGQSTWVWTSWDGATTQDGNPFDPFGFTREPEKTEAQRKEEAKKLLQGEALVIGVKIACLGALSLVGMFPVGLFLYVIISIVYGMRKRLGGCFVPLIAPAAIVGIPFLVMLAPRAGMLTPTLIFACILSVLFDVRNMQQRIRTYQSVSTS